MLNVIASLRVSRWDRVMTEVCALLAQDTLPVAPATPVYRRRNSGQAARKEHQSIDTGTSFVPEVCNMQQYVRARLAEGSWSAS
jgi:hypothetical protein